MDKRRFVLVHAEARRRAVECVSSAPNGCSVVVGQPARSLDQNAAQWPILEAFAAQLQWPVNGRMERLTAEEWKDILSAAFAGESIRLAEGLSGGVVMLGQRTSKWTKARFSEWLEFLHSVAADRGVEVYAEI